MAQGVHKITQQFEEALCKYTGAPYCVAVDNCSNALFLALYYELNISEGGGKHSSFGIRPIINVPSNTYPSVPCEIIHAGAQVSFTYEGEYRKGAYRLSPTRVWDSALSFTHGMYVRGRTMCLSFTGPYKHLKLGKGGAILTDNIEEYLWMKKARFSGRSECSYFEDNFDTHSIIGWNFYMMPEIAARGLSLLQQFYDRSGQPLSNKDLELNYPDLSKFKLYK